MSSDRGHRLVDELFNLKDQARAHDDGGNFEEGLRARELAFAKFEELARVCGLDLMKDRLMQAALGQGSDVLLDRADASERQAAFDRIAYAAGELAQPVSNPDDPTRDEIVMLRRMIIRFVIDFGQFLPKNVGLALVTSLHLVNLGQKVPLLFAPHSAQRWGDKSSKWIANYATICAIWYHAGYNGLTLDQAAGDIAAKFVNTGTVVDLDTLRRWMSDQTPPLGATAQEWRDRGRADKTAGAAFEFPETVAQDVTGLWELYRALPRRPEKPAV